MNQPTNNPLPESGKPSSEPAPSRRARYWRWLRSAALLLAVVLGLHFYQTRNTASGIAPPLEGWDLNGNPVSLAALRGQPVLVHFWATWCPICRATDSSIDAIADDVAVVTVALEDSSTKELKAYLEKEGLSFTVVPDPNGELGARYGVRGVPASFIVDPAGEIRFTEVGYTTEWGLRLRLWLAARLASASQGADSQ